jgi:hypothetical protein
VSTAAAVAAGDPSPATLVASYDLLRRVALGRRGPDDGPSLGFTVLLRQGMAAWLRAWAQCPSPPALTPHVSPLIAIPSILHTELAHVWAHMALAHQEAAWI